MDNEDAFNKFYSEVKDIEQRDAVLTSSQQIERLLRPGATYRNLNPFDVLQIEPDLPLTEVKKKYRKLSILLHPDKNQNDKDRAQTAFDIISKAYKTLEDEKCRKRCLEIVEEAVYKVNKSIKDRENQLNRQESADRGRAGGISEEARASALAELKDPAKYKREVYVLTMKLFADYEIKRRESEKRAQEEKKRKREQELEQEENIRLKKEWTKNFEESREGRVSSWKDFQNSDSQSTTTRTKKKAKKPMYFKPPKTRPEQR